MATSNPNHSDSATEDVEEAGNLSSEDWARRWTKSQTFWHQQAVHPNLLSYEKTWPVAAAAQAVREGKAPASSAPVVIVPLCGKTVDLTWLYQQGYRVIGIEVVTQAIIEFFLEQQDVFPNYRAEKLPDSRNYRFLSGDDDRLEILQADIFSPSLTRELLRVGDGAAVVWDRASLVALNPHTRGRYAQVLTRLLHGTTGQQLVNTFDYPQEKMQGPPFSVSEAQVRALYPPQQGFKIDVLENAPLTLRNDGVNKVEARSITFNIVKLVKQ